MNMPEMSFDEWQNCNNKIKRHRKKERKQSECTADLLLFIRIDIDHH